MIKTKILCPNRLRRITGSFAFIKHLFWLRDGLRDVRAELGLRDVRAELALVMHTLHERPPLQTIMYVLDYEKIFKEQADPPAARTFFRQQPF